MDDQSDALIRFYSGVGVDSERRTLREILDWDDSQLEYRHDYIQWLFPNPEPSAFNPDAPLLTAQHIQTFSSEPLLRGNLLKSLLRMLSFYGMERVMDGNAIRIQRADNWGQRSRNWLTPHNHNYLRLTRILIATRSLGLADESAALFRFLDELSRSTEGNSISPTTRRYWQEASGSV